MAHSFSFPHLPNLLPSPRLPGISADLSGSSLLGKCLYVNKNSLQVFQRPACFPSQVPGRKITSWREKRVTEGVTLPPRTLGVCPLGPVPQGLLCQNSALSGDRVLGGGQGYLNNATVSGSRSWILDLIRLSKPGEKEGAKASLRNCFLSLLNGLFFPAFLPGPILGRKVHIVLLLQAHDGLSPLSLDKHFDLLSPHPLVFPSNQPAPKQRVFITLAALLPRTLPGPKAGPGSPAGAHMKALPAENPHGTKSCPHPSPGPGALNTGPRKLGLNAPRGKTALSHTGEEPP